MTTIFISHSSKDNDAAEHMKDWLEAEPRKHQVFLDFHPEAGISGGTKWEETLYDRLRRCQAVLPLLTPNWLASKWCFAEVVHARALGKLIVPAKVEPCETNGVLGDTQQIDLTTKNRAEGEQRLESRLKEIFDWDSERPPYPGLTAFQEDDAAIFFGRGPEIAAGVEKLNSLRRQGRGAPRFALLLGASGSGKSSLVRAGMLPRLKRNRDSWLPLPPFRPQENPLDELAWSLADAFAANEQPRPIDQLRQALADAADDSPPAGDRLLELVRDLQRAANQRDATVLLAIDQAEELFGYSNEAQAVRFLRLLRATLERSDRQLMALATLRSDFLGAFQTHSFLDDRAYSELFAYEEITVDPLPEERFREIIRGPAGLTGLEIDDDLVDQMVQDTGTRDALPLLAFAMRRMWDDETIREDNRFELKEYEELGGLEGAIRTAATEALDAPRRTEGEIGLLHAAFVPTMVRVNAEGEMARRRAYLDEIPARAVPLLRQFVDARLLITGRDQDARETIEVAHEALLRTWPVLTTWLDEDQDKLRLLESLHRNAAEWHEGGRQDDLLIHRDGRLTDALELVRDSRFALGDDMIERAYLDACQSTQDARERTEKEDQERRIRDAEQIAEEQRRYANAQEKIAVEQKRTTRRTKIGATIAAFLAIVSAAAGLFAWNQMTKASEEAARADKEAINATQRAEEAERQRQIALGRQLGVQALWLAENGRSSDLIEKAAVFTREAWQRAPTPEAHAAADRLLRSLPTIRIEHGEALNAITFSPDGNIVATASEDKTARLTDAKSGEEIAHIEHGAAVLDIAFARDGKSFATASDDGIVRLLDTETGRELSSIHHDHAVLSVTFAPDGNILATASYDNTTRLINTTSGDEIGRIDHHGAVNAIAFAPDGNTLAIASGDMKSSSGGVRLFDARTGEKNAGTEYGDAVLDVAFAPDSNTLATASSDGTVRLLDAKTGREITSIDHDGAVWAVAFAPDGKTFATASGGDSKSAARILDAKSGRELARIDHDAATQAIAFSPDGSILATASKNAARLFDARTRQEIARIEHLDDVKAITFSPDGSTFATASNDKAARLIDPKSGQEIARVDQDNRFRVRHVVFAPDGNVVATASDDKTAGILDAKTGQEIDRINHDDDVWFVIFSPNGKTFATASDDKTARLFDARSRQQLARIEHRDRVNAIAFAPDGNTLATASGNFKENNGTARLLDAESGQEIARIEHGAPVIDVAFAPNGGTLATASSDNFARLFDTNTGQEIARIEHGAPVIDVAFAPDGFTLATVSGHKILRLIDLTNGQEIAQIEHDDSVNGVAFAPDGSILATASSDNFARLVDAKSGEEIARIEHGGNVWDVAFALDGSTLATASADTTSRILDAKTGEEIARIEHGGNVWDVTFAPDSNTLATAGDDATRVLYHPNVIVDLLCTRAGENLKASEWRAYFGKETLRPTCDGWTNPEDVAASRETVK